MARGKAADHEPVKLPGQGLDTPQTGTAAAAIAAMNAEANKEEAKAGKVAEAIPLAEALIAAKHEDEGGEDDGPGQSLLAERMEIAAEDTVIGIEDLPNLVGVLRDAMVEQIKMRPKPWSAMDEGEQRDVFAAVEHAANEFVRKAVEAIVSGGKSEPIRALLTKFTHGEEIVITAKVKPHNEEEAIAAVIGLHKAIGKNVMIQVASAADYNGSDDPEIDPDHPGFGFEADSEEE